MTWKGYLLPTYSLAPSLSPSLSHPVIHSQFSAVVYIPLLFLLPSAQRNGTFCLSSRMSNIYRWKKWSSMLSADMFAALYQSGNVNERSLCQENSVSVQTGPQLWSASESLLRSGPHCCGCFRPSPHRHPSSTFSSHFLVLLVFLLHPRLSISCQDFPLAESSRSKQNLTQPESFNEKSHNYAEPAYLRTCLASAISGPV